MLDISVIIPTYNRIDQLKKIIKALENQTYPKSDFEVIVISDGSTDGTNAYLSGISTSFVLRPVVQANAGPAAARNTGAREAKADLLLFLDDDVLPDPGLIQNHIHNHASIGAKSIVLGPLLTPKDLQMSPWVAWEQTMLEKQYASMMNGVYEATSRQFFTGNASIKRAFFFSNGCFDPQFRRAEDVEFAYRAESTGASFTFNPEAKGYHYAQRSFESWLQTPYLYGMNDVKFTHEKGIDWLLPQICKEYRKRNFVLRAILPLFLDHKNIHASLIGLFRAVGNQTYQQKLYRISRFAFSFIFNLQYYQGISDELGGREKFYAVLDQV